ncbi:TlpA disulfide reductase family protein [Ulvibacter antarcticus]|uniref:Peroxiredoxin n=1 Tax=Ulvibacter antarcticus TaxID=442714 RepID=A0A3L9YDU5_9FLAO|nr:TlpA disulfide reductase family protein [Ulvibacter antarcticus]RMA58624.1 peroxiredoxin [Ulvibacter antarcticus]
MLRSFYLFLITIFLLSCQKEINTPKEGNWRAVLQLNEGKEIPFLFQYNADNSLIIKNAEEEIVVNDVSIVGDSIFIEMPVYEGFFKGVFSKDSIYGDFVKPSLNRIVPFLMKRTKDPRFPYPVAPDSEITGNWEAVFSPNSEANKYIAKGIFKQVGNKVTGTIRTTTGDYRYLDGVLVADTLKMSTFDGAHAFLFEAIVKDSVIQGQFYSGNHFKENFIAKRNNAYELPEPDSLTYLKEGSDRIEFSFPDVEGAVVSLDDERFKNKIVIVQIMGTWCPNCLDETKFLSKFYEGEKREDLEIVALAFEYAPTKEKAIASINKLVDEVGVPYPVLLAQFGTSDKKIANKKLPMLNHILSYPTTIFIDRSGAVRRIHTGFNGPATEEKYDEFVADFEAFVDKLIDEQSTP